MDICDLLVEEGLLTDKSAEHLRRQAQRKRVALVGVVVGEGRIPADQVASLAASHAGLEYRAGPVTPDRQAAAVMSWEDAKRWLVLPVSFGRASDGPALRLAVADPLDEGTLEFVEELEQKTSMSVRPFVADLDHLAEAIDKAYSSLVTQVLTRPIQPKVSRVEAEPSGAEPTTVPSYSVVSEATMAVRLQALVELLEHKGLLTREEYASWVQRIMERQGG